MNVRLFLVVLVCVGVRLFGIQGCYLPLMNWDQRNHEVLQELLNSYGKDSPNYDPQNPPYAIFDWDNTCIFNDTSSAFFYYQLWTLQLRLSEDQLRSLLLDEINGVRSVTEGGKTYQLKDLNADILTAYAYLRQHYEGFEGNMTIEEIRKQPEFWEFITKIVFLDEMYGHTEGIDPFYNFAWIGFFMAGFTVEQITKMAWEELHFEMTAPLDRKIWKSSETYLSRAGPVSVQIRSGLRNRAEMESLMAAFRTAGIDVYVISAGFKYIVDVFAGPNSLGYNVPSNHIFALEFEQENGRLLPQTKKGSIPTFGKGKAETVCKVFAERGDPLFVAGDNDNDYYMLTLSGTRLNLIINRLLQGKIDTLIKKAAEQKADASPRYILQGFDQHLGIFIPSSNTSAYVR